MRPYLNKSIDQLEGLFAAAKAASDLKAIRMLSEELRKRKTSRAKALEAQVDNLLNAIASTSIPKALTPKPNPVQPVSAHRNPTEPVQDALATKSAAVGLAEGATPYSEAPLSPKLGNEASKELEAPRVPKRETSRRSPRGLRRVTRVTIPKGLSLDEASNLISGWTAIEVLSPPQTFRHPADLADRDYRRVAELPDDGLLPWQRNEKSRPNRRLFYHVVLGAIRMQDATARLMEAFRDADIERASPTGFAPIAILTLDKVGLPIAEPAVTISSFAWGLPIALAKDLEALGSWPSVETKLLVALDKCVRRADPTSGEALSIDRPTLTATFERLVEILKLPRDLIEPPHFAIRVYHWWKAEEPPDPPPMGSFFLGDLARVKALVTGKSVPGGLARYLGLQRPDTYLDLLCDDAALDVAVAPGVTPAARWPAMGGHPLVTLQQAAVNLATAPNDATKLLPVNGPPGTGKTTILRDLVASVVVQRARRMMEFDDPSSAFVHADKAKLDGAFAHLYKIDDRLKGFEIVVASSNNKAVENVSKELPLLTAIDEKCSLRYFECTANAVSRGEVATDDELDQKDLFEAEVLPRKAWGLISAVLGNARNRYAFRQMAWMHEDYGLKRYLLEASGIPQVFERKDPKTGRIVEKRKPQVVVEEKPPKNADDAKRRWKEARARFRNALNVVEKRLATLEEGRNIVAKSASYDAVTSAQQVLINLVEDLTKQRAILRAAEPEVEQANALVRETASALRAHRATKPGLFSALFAGEENARWKHMAKELESAFTQAEVRGREADALLEVLKHKVDEIELSIAKTRSSLESARSQQQAFLATVSNAEAISGHRFADAAFFERNRSDVHRDTPWLDNETNALRADLFGTAMQLHRAFVDVAAKPVRNNLDLLFRTFFGKSAWHPKVRPLLPDLWATLHCVIPVVSTTFASVERMLGPLASESIGWMLLDESGQASPQHAAGAIMRGKRVVVVGDPLQLEPVTTLPSELGVGIAKQFKIDANGFIAPEASVQTLSDAASEYGTTLEREDGVIRLGVPLIVHRRCADPMFSLANRVAYAGLMVNGRGASKSHIRAILGLSCWIDVRPDRCDDKWSESEWFALKGMIERLAAGNLASADFYVISPFRIVAQKLRERFLRLPELRKWTAHPEKWVAERIGTIHTVQGREADTVFIILGAAEAAREGARRWAGSKPNLLNVAVTRAKENLYVVGNRYAWASAGVFAELDATLPSCAGGGN